MAFRDACINNKNRMFQRGSISPAQYNKLINDCQGGGFTTHVADQIERLKLQASDLSAGLQNQYNKALNAAKRFFSSSEGQDAIAGSVLGPAARIIRPTTTATRSVSRQISSGFRKFVVGLIITSIAIVILNFAFRGILKRTF